MLRKVTLTMVFFSSLLFGICFTPAIATATDQPTPTDQLNFAVGQQRRIFVQVATLEVKIVQIGADGWLLVEMVEDAPSWYIEVGDRYWLNTNEILMISE